MNPAFSVIILTTVVGAAQGLVVALAIAVLAGAQVGPALVSNGLLVAGLMLLAGLAASFFHLGRPARAWRAAAMWRTSWLSREVIVLPAFIGTVALWWLALRTQEPSALTTVWLPLAAVVIAALLWYCTAMIYACLRFIEEWSHPLTLVNFVVIGLSSGLLLAAALGSVAGTEAFVTRVGTAAIAATLLAWSTRLAALRRNAGLRHRSTLQSATGIQSPQLTQRSMGFTGGSFNTREFFHRATQLGLRRVKLALNLFGFLLPALAAIAALAEGGAWLWIAAVLLQAPGLVADRWFFFAQARHPQNLYYQVVS